MEPNKDLKGRITYDKLFWLFMAGSVFGVILEGVFCLIIKGIWESHVVALVGQLNVLYGAGAVLSFVAATLLKNKSIILRSLVIMAVFTLLELFGGILLADGIGMKAWDYSNRMLNYRGIICFNFTLVWGAAGFVFCLLYDKIDKVLCKLCGKKLHIVCIALSIFVAVDLAVTAAAIGRWSSRHYGSEATGFARSLIDKYTPDDMMQSKFIEWSFLE
ncbi:MAG: putative ABC transporter permease [Clostridiales bacterium]|nr:putative ABC transporter permease [Clostridiales bacterium]